jgi:ABC-type multidrug transport system fused ATPase/permease subunit
MAGGRVVEAGAPADLEAAGGEYARLLAGWRAAADWQVR